MANGTGDEMVMLQVNTMGSSRSEIKRLVRSADRRRRVTTWLLVAPAITFLLLAFIAPILAYMVRAVDNRETALVLTRTSRALATWNGADLPGEDAFVALVEDIKALPRSDAAVLGRRLNYNIPGFRQMILSLHGAELAAGRSTKAQVLSTQPAWGDLRHWQVLRRESGAVTWFYVLSALDLTIENGHLQQVTGERGLFRTVFGRTFYISATVTLLCILLGFPVAVMLSTASPRVYGIAMAGVLLPFWTSVLVRTTSWIILLQQKGLLNTFLLDVGVITDPLKLIYNRFGVFLAMTHVLLPFFILPLYSVMKRLRRDQLRAAASLGATPAATFWTVYLPQIMPGIVAGAVLVFVTALGYYITPVLVGGGADQMISYFIAFYTNATVNWGLASALGILLLVAVLTLLGLFWRLLRTEGLKEVR
jgi:putative spermidine/putrescine transport system permease protein